MRVYDRSYVEGGVIVHFPPKNQVTKPGRALARSGSVSSENAGGGELGIR